MPDLTLENVQANLPLIDLGIGAATPYFEDWLYRVVEDLNAITASTVASASNLGAGAEVFDALVATDLQFRTLSSSDASVTITQGLTEIDLVVGGSIADGTVANSMLTWSGTAWTEFSELLLSHSAGALSMTVEDSLGVDQLVMLADADDTVSLYYDGAATLRTAAAASGGAEANNTSTGAGFERVLTASDLVTTLAMTALTATAWRTFYSDGAGAVTELALGSTVGHVLTSNGAAVAPSWQAAGGSSLVQFADNGLVAEVYYNSILALNSHAGGIEVSDTSGGITSVRLMTDAAVQMASYWADSTGEVYIDSNNHGGNVNLRGEDAGGTMRDLLIGDPDGRLNLYHDDGLVFETDDTGIHVLSAGGTTTTIRFYDNVAVQHGVIFTGPTVALSLRGSVSGGDVFIGGTDAGAAAVDLLNADPDGGLDLYYDDNLKFSTQLSGVRIYTQTGGASAAEFTDSTGATRYGRLVATSSAFSFGASQNSATVNMTSVDSGGTATFILAGDPDDAAVLYHDGTVSISTTASGMSFRDNSGNDPALSFQDDVGTQVGLIQALSGASMRIRNTHVSDPIALQGTDSGSAITTVCEGDPDGSMDLYYDGTVTLATSLQGATLTHATGGTALLQISSATAQNSSINYLENSLTKMQIQYQPGTALGYIRIVDTGDDWQVYNDADGTYLYANAGGSVELYNNGLLALETGINGAGIRDANNNGDVVLALKNNAGTSVARLYSDITTAFYIDGQEDAVHTIMRGEDAASVTNTILNGDPDGALDLYYDGLAKAGTITTGFYVNHATLDPTLTFQENGSGVASAFYDISTNELKIRTLEAGGDLLLQVRNGADSAYQALLTGVADGAVTLSYAGTDTLRTQADSAQIAVGGTEWHDIPMEQSANKQATTTRSSTTVLADDPDLTFALPSTGWYSIEAYLRVTSASATPDLKHAFAYTGTITSGGYMFTGADNGAGTSSKDNVGIITTATIVDCDGTDANGITLKGYIEVSTTGTLSWQWAQNVSDATSIQVQTGSWMKVAYIVA